VKSAPLSTARSIPVQHANVRSDIAICARAGALTASDSTWRAYLTAYLDGAELRGDPKGPLFRTIGRGTGKLTRRVLPQANAYAMIGRRAAAAGIATKLGNHSFRATGITAYLKNGGTLEKAAAMANHASTRTTQLYDRRRDEVSLDEVERIVI
jgi:integrase